MKKYISILLCLLLLFSVLPAVSASPPKIVDNAGLLTPVEAASLEARAQKIADDYQIDVVILTVWSLDGKESREYADDFFDFGGYGIGEDFSGVLFLLSMENREWAVSTCGRGISALPNSKVDDLFSEIAPELRNDDYYRAFGRYLDELEQYYAAYTRQPVKGSTGKQVLFNLLIALAVGAATAGIVLLVLRGQMKTAVPQSGAAGYLNSGSYQLYRRQDTFLYSRVTKTRRASDSNTAGGSAHRSSSGRSHGGGHGHF